jgi:hypothetical protein
LISDSDGVEGFVQFFFYNLAPLRSCELTGRLLLGKRQKKWQNQGVSKKKEMQKTKELMSKVSLTLGLRFPHTCTFIH